jgi:hypothetical protein
VRLEHSDREERSDGHAVPRGGAVGVGCDLRRAGLDARPVREVRVRSEQGDDPCGGAHRSPRAQITSSVCAE